MTAKLSSSMEHIRKALEQTVKGRMVDPETMALALEELSIAEAIQAGRTTKDMIFLAPDLSDADLTLMRLGTTYLILQTFFQEMHKAGHLSQINGKVADCLIATHAHLLKSGYEMRHIPAMSFTHVAHKDKS